MAHRAIRCNGKAVPDGFGSVKTTMRTVDGGRMDFSAPIRDDAQFALWLMLNMCAGDKGPNINTMDKRPEWAKVRRAVKQLIGAAKAVR
jgi:hypothetical protein